MEYILITGAYGGMGRATVQALRARGYGVFASIFFMNSLIFCKISRNSLCILRTEFFWNMHARIRHDSFKVFSAYKNVF